MRHHEDPIVKSHAMLKSSRQGQNGSALLVSIILLLMLSVVVFFAVRAGLSEQRTAVTDARGKVARLVAEAGINHALGYVHNRASTLFPLAGVLPDSALWTACAATDQTFPCGGIDPASSSSARRALYFAYTAGVDDGRAASAAAVDARSLPLVQTFSAVGNFPVTYNVGALLCMLNSTTTVFGSGGAVCTNDASRSNTVTVTLISTGQIDNESARATISETVGQYRIVDTPPGLPPVVASSVVTGLGNSTIVGNPNGGGPGVVLSVWTRATLGAVGDTSSGSFQTCEADAFFRDAATTVASNGAMLCDSCDCPSADKVSQNGVEGKDMLDRDSTDTGVNKATDTVLSPTYKFPCDLFAYVFGTPARANLVTTDTYSDVPALCETQIDSDGDGVKDVNKYIADNFIRETNCDSMVGRTGGGNYYLPNGCGLSGGGVIGSPTTPVVMIVDSSFKNTGPTIYGLVFVRDPIAVYSGCSDGVCASGLADYAPGGGTAAIYGALVIEGPGKLNGGLKVISSPNILSAIINSPNNRRFARVPGSWNDSLSF